MNSTELVTIKLEGNGNNPANLNTAHELVSDAIHKKNLEGYKVVSVTPLTGSDYETAPFENESYAYGISFTIGILIVFEKIDS